MKTKTFLLRKTSQINLKVQLKREKQIERVSKNLQNFSSYSIITTVKVSTKSVFHQQNCLITTCHKRSYI